VASFGFFVETVEHKCEGMVSVRDLSEYDDFRLDEADYALVGLRTKQKFRMGDAVRVRVVAASLAKRQLDFEWVTASVKGNSIKPGSQTKAKSKAPAKAASKAKPVAKKKK
jgi:ribonuclease R